MRRLVFQTPALVRTKARKKGFPRGSHAPPSSIFSLDSPNVQFPMSWLANIYDKWKTKWQMMCLACMGQEYKHAYRLGKHGNPRDFLLKLPAKREHCTRVSPFCHRSGFEALPFQVGCVAAVCAVQAHPHVRIRVYSVLDKNKTENERQNSKTCGNCGRLELNAQYVM